MRSARILLFAADGLKARRRRFATVCSTAKLNDMLTRWHWGVQSRLFLPDGPRLSHDTAPLEIGSSEMHKVTDVRVLDNYRLDLTFADGTRGTVALSDLVGRGVFDEWSDYDVFRAVKIGDTGELIWGDQIDLCPDSLYLAATGKRPEDIFPRLR